MQEGETMEAGRELDALIAEKVLGLTPCWGWQRFNLGSAGGPAWRKDCTHERGTCYPGGHPCAYSTDIRAAWQIVEKLNAQGILVQVHSYPLEDDCYGVQLLKKAPESDRWHSLCDFISGDWIPHAICLAALQALGVERPDTADAAAG